MKYCEKCGKEIPDGNGLCPNCGASGNAPQNPAQGTPYLAVRKQNVDIVSIVCFAVAGLILILSLVACFKIMGGAGDMSSLRSVGGTTVAEAYYNYCGAVYGGFALFVMAFGLFASGLLAYLGFNNMKK